MSQLPQIRLSVRAFVEFLLRSGDLDNRRNAFADKEAMQKGSRIHRKIQKAMPVGYRAEVPLIYEKKYDEFTLRIEGRADGIWTEPEGVTIDEIKGIYMDLEQLTAPIPVHLAQAKCYAYIYSLQNHLETIAVQMTYCNLDSEEKKYFRETYTQNELDLWFSGLVDEYYKWAKFQYDWRQIRNRSMQGLEFPFPYRDGQRELVQGIYRTILRKKQLFVQAPTGIGKTMCTVFPSVRAVGEGLAEQIFYLTAKTIARTVAEEAFQILKARGLKYKVITITAKEKLCICDEAECNPQHCPRAKGHFDRVNDAVFEILNQEDIYTRERLLEHSEKWQVCPYEMCLDIASWCDAVICDYNYVFDPDVKLKRFFGEGVKGEYLFLIDEAHNLVDRGRDIFSAALYKEDFLAMKRIAKLFDKKLERLTDRCNKKLLEYKRECDGCRVMESISDFVLPLLGLMSELETCLETLRDEELRRQVLEFYFQVRSFLMIYELVDENYVIYAQHEEDGRFKIKLFCVNPAANIQECLDRGRSTVFFSATLLPVQYYKKLLSTREDDYAVYVDSPFCQEKRCLILCRDVSSRYTRRNETEYRKIAAYIHAAASAKAGNYMAFFPSYRLMEDVLSVYRSEFAGENVEILVQGTGMTEVQREEFLGKFQEKNDRSLVGFCVMGGIFSEGIDLAGEKLIGAVVIGTGIPQIGQERELLKEFYDKKGENGFDYAYRFPGMNKVLQSAGRVIRTREDVGVILLLDDRFCTREYEMLFPREWAERTTATLPAVPGILQSFWEKN
ncbi:MAG TPA: ATP-dependent DNA helicase [Candidatus Egerieimonas faecigallinarum]|nr:ATP-dependent DNA helicase [Candidatus Egerieimonas faecigallinarum]